MDKTWRFASEILSIALRARKCTTYLGYHINKDLGVVSRQVPDHLNLIAIREDPCNQGNSLVRGEGTANQPFPCWAFTSNEKTVESTNARLLERMKKPTES